jgi:hypothetical protein
MNIKRMSVWIGVAILLVLFASSCVSCPDPCPEYPEYPECEECPPSRECPICTKCPECFPCETKCIDQCFGFTDYKAGTNFSNQFGYYDVKFESIDGSDLEVWEVDGERSLHLPTAGIRIFLPCPAYEVLVRVGSWAGGPFNVTAYDGNKNMVVIIVFTRSHFPVRIYKWWLSRKWVTTRELCIEYVSIMNDHSLS